MTDIKKKALALVNEVAKEFGYPAHSDITDAPDFAVDHALCRAIEQHEAFKREVSDAIDSSVLTPETEAHLSRFIIAKPDPLVEAMRDWWDTDGYASIETFRAAIEARGGRIVWEGE